MAGIIRADVDETIFAPRSDMHRLIQPFLKAEFDVTWALKVGGSRSSIVICFLKPKPELCEIYGFEYEVLLAFSPFSSLDARTFRPINKMLTEGPAKGRVESMVYFLVSKSTNTNDEVESYLLEHREERNVIPIHFEELANINASSQVVHSAIRKHYLSLDLFKYTLPLYEDTYFFGRDAELARLLEVNKRRENCGLFGLRKTGKTSLLFKLKRTLEQNKGNIVAYFDAQDTSIRMKNWNELLKYMVERLSAQTEVKIDRSFSPKEASDDFDYALNLMISKKSIKSITIIIDEVEWISPVTCKDVHWNQEFLDFWHTIRTFQSRNRKLSVVISGVNPSMVEKDIFESHQNPLFGIVSPVFLSGLSKDESNSMIRKIGKVMGLKFSKDALQYIYDQYGGHPLLTRLSCSYINDMVKNTVKDLPIQINETILIDSENLRNRELSFYCRHIVSELEQFYPDEYELLEILSTEGYLEFVKLARRSNTAIHLYKYGIIANPDTPYITQAVVQDYIAEENARRSGRETRFKVIDVDIREDFIKIKVKSIIEDMRTLEACIRRNNKPILFGPNSFPEADRLVEMENVKDRKAFEVNITSLNRSFVESIEKYGVSINDKNYFWGVLKTSYPDLQRSLHRIKVYRHNSQHLILNQQTDTALASFLKRDLEGDMVFSPDKYWVLFQRCLDDLHQALQKEINNI